MPHHHERGEVTMLDAPLQLLIGIVATVLFARRGNRLWLAAGKGALVSVCLTTVLGIVLAITAGTDWSTVLCRHRERYSRSPAASGTGS
jgi:hypothetical protein